MYTLTGHKQTVRALAYAPGGAPLLASAGDDRTVRFWDVVARQEVTCLESRQDGILSLAFSPDGKRIATGGRAGTILVWDVASRQRDPGREYGAGRIASLAFSSDGRALLCGIAQRYGDSSDRLLCWNLEPLHLPQWLDWMGSLESVAFCPARDTFALAGQHRGVEFWEIGRPRNDPAFWMPSRVRALRYSPGEGRWLAVAGGKTVGLWDIEAKTWKAQCKGHKGDVLALAFSPDGLTLLSGGMDRSIRLWETLTGRQLAAWDWKIGLINALDYAADGMTAAAAGDKPTIVVWDIDET